VLHESLVGAAADASEEDGVLVLDPYFKVLAGLQVKALPHGAGQDDLAFL
jgi:hypothetical protein